MPGIASLAILFRLFVGMFCPECSAGHSFSQFLIKLCDDADPFLGLFQSTLANALIISLSLGLSLICSLGMFAAAGYLLERLFIKKKTPAVVKTPPPAAEDDD